MSKDIERRTQWFDIRIRANEGIHHTEIDIKLLYALNAVYMGLQNDGHFHIGGITGKTFPVIGFTNESGRVIQVTPKYELVDGRVLQEGDGHKSRVVRIPPWYEGITALDPTDEVLHGEVAKAVFDVTCVDSASDGFSLILSVTPPKPRLN